MDKEVPSPILFNTIKNPIKIIKNTINDDKKMIKK